MYSDSDYTELWKRWDALTEKTQAEMRENPAVQVRIDQLVQERISAEKNPEAILRWCEIGVMLRVLQFPTLLPKVQ